MKRALARSTDGDVIPVEVDGEGNAWPAGAFDVEALRRLHREFMEGQERAAALCDSRRPAESE